MMTATELARMLTEDQARFDAARLSLEQAIDHMRRAQFRLWAMLDDGGERLSNALREAAER